MPCPFVSFTSVQLEICKLHYGAKFPVCFNIHIFRANENLALGIVLMACALLLGVLTVANLYTWSRLLRTVFFSQRRHLQRSIAKLETLKSEGFLQTLRQEVSNEDFKKI